MSDARNRSAGSAPQTPVEGAAHPVRATNHGKAFADDDSLFRCVVEASPSAMVLVNDAGRIEMVNVQAERVFGYARAEMIGQPVEILVPDQFRGQHPGLRQSFVADPQARPMGTGRDLFARRKDGSEFPVEIGLNPIQIEDGTMVLSVIVDISDRKQKERSIELALQEKDVLLGEIHHRVKNNLQVVHSLLDLQSAQITDPMVLGMLRDSQNRIRSMALIHQTLYQSKAFAKVDFGTFLDSFAPILVSSYAIGTAKIDLLIEAAGILLPVSSAIPCGLIVNELISNALKHAFPDQRSGRIFVDLRTDGAFLLLTVGDDGIGLPDDLDIRTTSSLGLQLVTLLTDQLRGTLTITRSNPTSFAIRFPLSD